MPSDREEIVAFAQAQLGKPYVWGAEGPNSYDCSGLVYAAYKAAGLPAKRVSAATLGKSGQSVDQGDAMPGDVVYYDEPGATDHVGIYVGGGKMIDAPTQGKPVELVAVGNPTSFRRLGLTDEGNFDPAGTIGQQGSVSDNIGDTVSGAVSALNPFQNWQSDALGLALKVAGALAAAALVIVGAREALTEGKGTT